MDYPKIIQNLYDEKYNDAEVIFWGGSLSKGMGTDKSDLDLVIVYKNLTNAFRESYIYEGIRIETFVHNIKSIEYFFNENRDTTRSPGLISLIKDAVEIPKGTKLSYSIKALANEYYTKGPKPLTKDELDKLRYFITDILDDIMSPYSNHEQMASCIKLYNVLADFYFSSQNKWTSSGKYIAKYLENENPLLATEFYESFQLVFNKGDTNKLEILVTNLLEPYGGLIWEGFKSFAKIKAENER